MKTIYILLIQASLLLLCSCEKEPTCQKTCVYGTLDEASCSCNCSDGYYGANCQYQEDNQSENEADEIRCNTIDQFIRWYSYAAPGYPAGTNYNNEATCELPDNYICHGVGFSVTNGNFTTIRMYGYELKEDCTFGPSGIYRGGVSPFSTCEKQFITPNGQAITGIGIGVSNDNVQVLMVKYRSVLANPNGGYYLGYEYTAYVGSGNIEAVLSTTSPGITNLNPEKAFISKVGASAYLDNVLELETRFTHLNSY